MSHGINPQDESAAIGQLTKLSEDDLAEVVADQSQPLIVRNAAYTLLAPAITEVAAQVARRFPGQVGRDVQDEALEVMYEKTQKYSRRGGRYRGFCAVCLLHDAVDKTRERRPPEPPPTEPTEPEEAKLVLDVWRVLKRKLIDRFVWGKSVYYLPVLLTEQRLRQAARVSRDAADWPLFGLQRSELIAWLEMWHDQEAGLALHTNCETIVRIWDAITPELDGPPYVLDRNEFTARVSHVSAPRGGHLTADNWYQLVKRSRDCAKCQLRAEEWETYFA